MPMCEVRGVVIFCRVESHSTHSTRDTVQMCRTVQYDVTCHVTRSSPHHHYFISHQQQSRIRRTSPFPFCDHTSRSSVHLFYPVTVRTSCKLFTVNNSIIIMTTAFPFGISWENKARYATEMTRANFSSIAFPCKQAQEKEKRLLLSYSCLRQPGSPTCCYHVKDAFSCSRLRRPDRDDNDAQ